jgi:hypothetical protein
MELAFWTQNYWYLLLFLLGLAVMGLLAGFIAACDRV